MYRVPPRNTRKRVIIPRSPRWDGDLLQFSSAAEVFKRSSRRSGSERQERPVRQGDVPSRVEVSPPRVSPGFVRVSPGFVRVKL